MENTFRELRVVDGHISPVGLLLPDDGSGLHDEDVGVGGGVGQVAPPPPAPRTIHSGPNRLCLRDKYNCNLSIEFFRYIIHCIFEIVSTLNFHDILYTEILR